MWLGEGAADVDITPEFVRDREVDLLAEMPSAEYRSAADEGRALHHRLLPRPGT